MAASSFALVIYAHGSAEAQANPAPVQAAPGPDLSPEPTPPALAPAEAAPSPAQAAPSPEQAAPVADPAVPGPQAGEPAPAAAVPPEPPPLPPMPEELTVHEEKAPVPATTSGEPVAAPVAAAEPSPVSADPGAIDSDGFRPTAKGLLFKVGDYKIRASGYVQAQYQNFSQSENQLSTDGLRLLNQTGIYLPRARAILEGRNEWSALVLEYDVANTTSMGNGLQRAEATLHWLDKKRDVPFIAATVGMFRTPFGAEAPRSARARLWMENATVTQAFFPGQSDIGARAEGSYKWFRYALAWVNGDPIMEPRFGGLNPNKQGDAMARLGVDTELGDKFRFVGGASVLKGRGFHPGDPATKESISVKDLNQNGVVIPNDITLEQGKAATPSQTFKRWGAGADLELNGTPVSMWQFWLRGEFMFGQNMDRGIFLADPVASGYDLRSYGAVGTLENLLYSVLLLAVRYDVYQPNPDTTGQVGGKLVPVAQGIKTTSGMVGFQLPGTLTRLVGQYDWVQDHLGLGVNGRPADLKNNRFTLRLQVSL